MKSIQIRKDNFDIKNNPKVKDKYPELYAQIMRHDKDSFSSWYELTDDAYEEYMDYLQDYDIGYIDSN